MREESGRERSARLGRARRMRRRAKGGNVGGRVGQVRGVEGGGRRKVGG